MPHSSPTLNALHWPNDEGDMLGVQHWSKTNDNDFSSIVATLQRTDDAIRARVFTRDFGGEQKALFCAVWAVDAAGERLTHHKVLDQDQALDQSAAIGTFQDHVNAIGERPQFTYGGEATVAKAAALTSVSPVTIPRVLRVR